MGREVRNILLSGECVVVGVFPFNIIS